MLRTQYVLTAAAAAIFASGLQRPAHAEVSAMTDDQKTEFITARLHDGASASRVWQYGWLATYGSLAAAQGTLALMAEQIVDGDSRDVRGYRATQVVGAASAALGIVPLLFFSPTSAARNSPGELDAMPQNTPEQRKAKLAAAEQALRTAAHEESEGRSWLTHALGGAVAVGGSLVLWLGYDRPVDAAINFGSSLAISEIQIWTQPTRAISDWQAYCAATGTASATARPRSGIKWAMSGMPMGLVVTASF